MYRDVITGRRPSPANRIHLYNDLFTWTFVEGKKFTDVGHEMLTVILTLTIIFNVMSAANLLNDFNTLTTRTNCGINSFNRCGALNQFTSLGDRVSKGRDLVGKVMPNGTNLAGCCASCGRSTNGLKRDALTTIASNRSNSVGTASHFILGASITGLIFSVNCDTSVASFVVSKSRCSSCCCYVGRSATVCIDGSSAGLVTRNGGI